MNGWVSEGELTGKPRLDWGEAIGPGDLAQGWLGNCWLIASIAALAEFPAAVQQLFVEADAAAGRYFVRLYDMGKASWEHVEIDDHIPCTHEADWSGVAHTVDASGARVYRYEDVYNAQGLLKVPGVWTPLFGRPKGNKIWALLLEKAVAKFVGSYALLAGGAEPYALTAFTGFPLVYCFLRPAGDDEETWAALGYWEWRGAQYMGREATGHCYTNVPDAPASLPDSQMWAKLVEYDARNFLMTASITKYRQPESARGFFRDDGLVLGHAYSLLSGRCAVDRRGETVRLVMLRNPHGQSSSTVDGVYASQWNGAWSNSSELWGAHPEVALQVGYTPSDDGIFWMSWEDFQRIFDKICVLAKNMRDLRAVAAGPGHRQAAAEDICLGLARMADAKMREDLRQLSLTFDPFASIPEFLDDGTLETRLLWEATKPGRVQAFLDVNRSSGNDAGYKLLLGKVAELGLSRALGKDGWVRRPTLVPAAGVAAN